MRIGSVDMGLRSFRRLLVTASLLTAETAAALSLVLVLAGSASAQLFDDRFPFLGGRNRPQFNNPFQGFFAPYPPPEAPRPPPVDYSRAPPPKKTDAVPMTNVVVLGDSMADWLAYGLEHAFAEAPEMGVLRRQRTVSGLIRQQVRHDPRGDHPDWPKFARETLAAEKPDFIVMMIGLQDRRPIREQQRAPARGNSRTGQPPDQVAPETEQQAKPPAADDTETETDAQPQGPGVSHDFRSERWAELYIKRIDDTITAMKSKGVPVLWVGLPPVRGTKSMSDVAYLNELYRGRAEKAGIVYVDVWDGFVDESGRFAAQGPDFEGQTRRLRTADGVYFTQAGARKLAHYVDREIQRFMSSRITPVALPAPEEPTPQTPAGRPGGGAARPLAGPVMPLTTANARDAEALLGSSGAQQSVTDAVAAKVLVNGEAMPAPAGRADDFVWPRRGVAPVGSDPVVATTTLPMTPMLAERPPPSSATPTAVAAAPPRPRATPGQPTPLRPPGVAHAQAQQQQQYRYEQQRRPFFFPFLFGR
jgi:hypothetical protein